MYAFDGTKPHETAEYSGDIESRLTIVFFQSNRGWNAPPGTIQELAELDFNPASSAVDAEGFSSRFDELSEERSRASWKLNG